MVGWKEVMKFPLKGKTGKIINEILKFVLLFSLFSAFILGYIKMYIVVILSVILLMLITPKEKTYVNDSKSRKERKRRKNNPKVEMKNKLCKILFIVYVLVSFTFLLLLRHGLLPASYMKYFWVYIVGAMLSYFILLFVSVFYCPYALGSPTNTKSKPSRDFSAISDGVE